MWYFTKQTLFYFVYLLFLSLSTFIISYLNIIALKMVLIYLCLGLFGFIVVMASYKEGLEAMKLLISNDAQRRRMIETGDPIPLKTVSEYKTWKGFFMGFLVAVPLIICMIIHAILISTTGGQGAGAVGSAIYMLFYSLYAEFLSKAVVATATHYFYVLICVPILMLLTGIPYMLGAKKATKHKDSIDEKHAMIYGKKK